MGLGFAATVLESARQTLVLTLQRRHLIRLGFGLGLMFVLGWVLASRAHDRADGRMLYCMLAWWLLATVVVPWSAFFLGAQSVHGPIEDRTYQYLFIRPVGRTPLLLGKWLALGTLVSVQGALAAAATFAGIATNPERWPDGRDFGLVWTFAIVLCWSAFAYAAAAVLFAAALRRPLVWAAFFVVGVQALAANLKVSAGLRQLTITDPLRRMVLDLVEPDRRLAAALWPAESSFHPDMVGRPQLSLLVFIACCLGLALWRYAAAEYESRSRD